MTATSRRPPYRLLAAMLTLLVAVVSAQLAVQVPKAMAAVRPAR